MTSTYRDAGVDLAAAERLVDAIKPAVTATWNDRVVGGFGGFAGGLTLPDGYRRPVLMMSTDGVGTKGEIARRMGIVDGLGWDLVAMCIDDLAAAGAHPVAMTDYIAVGSLDVERVTTIVESIARACAAAGVALIGGETAEHPGVMATDQFDLAGAALGVVESGHQIDGSAIVAGDVVVGVDSPNVRSNGFSLVRRIFGDSYETNHGGDTRTIGERLLEPSVLYTPFANAVAPLRPHGLVHVTGGGLPGNVPRVLPKHLDAEVDTGLWHQPAIFTTIQRVGSIPDHEMLHTFNMGIGFVAIVPEGLVDDVITAAAGVDRTATAIGRIIDGSGSLRLV
jgi:phosphoribosylformylglycinamidine cyclo-ligase